MYYTLFDSFKRTKNSTGKFFQYNVRNAIDAEIQGLFNRHFSGVFYAFVIPRFFFSLFFLMEKNR